MSDNRSISEILDQATKMHRQTLARQDDDSDGKDDFTEGETYFEQLQKIDLPKETIENYEKVFQSHRSFGDRVKSFLKAENQAGRWAKVIKDFALIFVPYGKQISTVTEFINQRLLPESNNKDMAQSNETVFQQIKRRIKQPSTQAAIALIITVLGSSWVGLDIEVTAEQLTNSLAGIVTAAGALWAAVMSVVNLFRDDDAK